MTGRERCDEIMRLIDETLGSEVADDVTRGDRTSGAKHRQSPASIAFDV